MKFTGSRSQETGLSQTGVITFNVTDLEVNRGVVSGAIIDGLEAATEYLVTVQAVNGAIKGREIGEASEPVTAFTDSGEHSLSFVYSNIIIMAIGFWYSAYISS